MFDVGSDVYNKIFCYWVMYYVNLLFKNVV